MKTIRLYVFLLAALVTFGVSAQIGLQAGYSNERINVKASGISVKMATLNGFHVGPVAEMKVQGPISLQYALLYNFLTGKPNPDLFGELLNDSKITYHTLDLPVRIAGTFPISEGISAFVFGGPNFNFGLVAKETSGGESTDLYSQDGGFKRFDLQLGFGAGLKFNALSLRASYDFGLLNKMKDVEGDGTVKANDLKISLAYMF